MRAAIQPVLERFCLSASPFASCDASGDLDNALGIKFAWRPRPPHLTYWATGDSKTKAWTQATLDLNADRTLFADTRRIGVWDCRIITLFFTHDRRADIRTASIYQLPTAN